MDTETETISSMDIQLHMGYWVNMELIKGELTGIFPSYKSDEEFQDAFGLSHDYVRCKKKSFRQHSPLYENYTSKR
jgi:hypothetical protein